jgi:FtsP/CotA-like multicopper oxidase with cupredoxin domain
MKDRVRVVAVMAVAAVLALVAAACGGDDGGGTEGTEGDNAAAASLAVTLQEFSITPVTIHAPAGQQLSFDVSNAGSAPHTFAVDTGAGVEQTAELQPGDAGTLVVPALEAGSYRLFCTISGHADLGMEGQLMVMAAGEIAAGGTGASGASGAMGASGHAGMSMQDMLDGHREGVEAFPAETEAQGNQPLESRIENGVKVFELTAQEIQWETEPGTFVSAMGFNGTVPGPEIRVNQGDKIRVIVHNDMSQPTIVHFHGLTVPNDMDGVPFITQDPIMPGGFFTYEFTVADPPGMYVYHSHFNSTEQVGKGLYGAFYVEPKHGDWSSYYGEPVDVESTLFLGDGPTGYVLNGKGFPATQPIVAEQGQTVLVHLSNDGSIIHPMHLHGFHFQVVSEDGFILPPNQRYMADTLAVAPGQRFDVLVHADYPGVWAFHCHILPHVEGPQGMFGMVTALVVQ